MGIGFGQRRPLSPTAARNVTIVTTVLFVAVGVIFIVEGISKANSVSPVSGGVTTTGTIISFNTGQSCGRGGCTPWWQPTITFNTASDHLVTFTGPQDLSSETVGETVKVSYNPSNPTDAHDLSANVGSIGLLIGIAVLFILIAAFSFIRGHRRFAGKNSLFAAHTGGSSSVDLSSTSGGGFGTPPSSTASPGWWVGHRYLHSRLGLSVTILVFVGLVAAILFIIR
jgi:hypothetical protein